METALNPIEVRVLACLIEKSLATPEYYPMTLNALTAACNQKSNRNPLLVLSDEDTVRALDSLRDRRLANSVTFSGSRAPKYRHSVENHYAFSPPQLAVLCELMLRGPQTAGELRTHAERLCRAADVADVQSVVRSLMEWAGGPLAAVAPRRSGQREERYAHLLGGALPAESEAGEAPVEPARMTVQAENERIAALESQVASLTDELARLKAQFDEFAKQFQ